VRRTALITASTLGSILVLLVVGGSASGWVLPPSFPQTPLSDHAANNLPLPPGSKPVVADHCVRFPDPTNCKHPQAARVKVTGGSAPRVVNCGDQTAARDRSTELRACDRHGKGHILIFAG
jgi:hypothetical protein